MTPRFGRNVARWRCSLASAETGSAEGTVYCRGERSDTGINPTWGSGGYQKTRDTVGGRAFGTDDHQVGLVENSE